jgi:hypothetical protein
VLWRDAARGQEQVLLLYDGEEGQAPVDMLRLAAGGVTVAPPKSQRRGFPHAFRVETQSPGGGATKHILAAESAEACAGWCAALASEGGAGPASRREARQKVAGQQSEAGATLAALAADCPRPPGAVKRRSLAFSYENTFSMGLLYGRAGRLTPQNGSFRPLVPPPVWSTIYLLLQKATSPRFTILNVSDPGSTAAR